MTELIDEKTKEYLKEEFKQKLDKEVKILFFQGEPCEYCKEIKEIISTVADLSNGKIKIEEYDFDKDKEMVEKYKLEMQPALVMVSELFPKGNVRFYGIPSGYEFATLIEDILMFSTGKIDLPDEIKEEVKKIDKPVKMQIFITPTCPYCPRAVLVAHQFAALNENIIGDMVEAIEFPEISDKYQVSAVPKNVINDGKVMFEGAAPPQYFLEKVKEAL